MSRGRHSTGKKSKAWERRGRTGPSGPPRSSGVLSAARQCDGFALFGTMRKQYDGVALSIRSDDAGAHHHDARPGVPICARSGAVSSAAIGPNRFRAPDGWAGRTRAAFKGRETRRGVRVPPDAYANRRTTRQSRAAGNGKAAEKKRPET